MRPTGSQIVKLVVEVAFIVLAVIIALAVDQWWEDRENPTVESRMQRDSLGVFLELRSRFGNTLSLRRTLATIYACALREMDAADSLQPEDCPEAGAGNSDEG